jgi:protein involved in sex pheromone biosynthesis
MKKTYLLLVSVMFFLASCSEPVDLADENSDEENSGVTNVPATEQEDQVTSRTEGSLNYETVIPYELSPSRGLTSTNMISSYNIEAFEKGLFNISEATFDPEDYIFREGQIFTEEMVRGFLNRAYTREELDDMSEEELADGTAFSNLGLNPSTEGESDPETIAEEAPLYLSHILEQNYMTEDSEGNLELEGMTIGLAMNSVYYYEGEDGTSESQELDEDVVREQGERMAGEILERIRANEQYKDLTIEFGIFIQSSDTSITPGHFVSYSVAEGGVNELSSFNDVNEEYVLFPSTEGEELNEETNNDYELFNRELSSYFDSFTTSVGHGYFKDDELEYLSIEIPIEYTSRGEIIGLSQYISDLLENHFAGIQVEVSIADKSTAYSLITKTADENIQTHIYE